MASSQDRREFWEGVVTTQRSSGLTGRAWCAANGVSLASFYLWRKKLSVSDTAAVARRSSGISWLEIEPARPTAASSGVTLRIGSVRIDVATGFEARALADVLAVLESRC